MTQILSFLGKGGSGRTTAAIALARQSAASGARTLVLSLGSDPSPDMLLAQDLAATPTAIAPNLEAVRIPATAAINRGWEELQTLEAQYLKTPFLRNIYSSELALLPGFEPLLLLTELRRWLDQGYDRICLDGLSSPELLRLWGVPESLDWYLRRFRGAIADSEFGRNLGPFLPALSAAVFSVGLSIDDWGPAARLLETALEQGRSLLADPRKAMAILTTRSDRVSQAVALQWWGAAQPIGLRVGAVLASETPALDDLKRDFAPLPIFALSSAAADSVLPSFDVLNRAPDPLTIDLQARQIKLFLPGLAKESVKLSQSGPEITIEAGDQRRNLRLPVALQGRAVASARFQEQSLILSFQ